MLIPYSMYTSWVELAAIAYSKQIEESNLHRAWIPHSNSYVQHDTNSKVDAQSSNSLTSCRATIIAKGAIIKALHEDAIGATFNRFSVGFELDEDYKPEIHIQTKPERDPYDGRRMAKHRIHWLFRAVSVSYLFRQPSTERLWIERTVKK